jgi:hypothetical protein
MQVPQPAANSAPPSAYDDGYSPELWSRAREAEPGEPADPPDPEPTFAQGEPPGYEDAPALRLHEEAEAYGRRSYGRPAAPIKQKASAKEGSTVSQQRPGASQLSSAKVQSEPPGSEEPPRAALGSAAEAATEPPGAAEPAELRSVPQAYGAATASAEPAGAEEPGALMAPIQGSAPTSQPAPGLSPSVPFSPPGVDDQYDDSLDAEGELSTPSMATESLTIVEKFRLAQPAAAFESSTEGYSCVNTDGEFNDPTHSAYQRKHYGLHWGLVQANQRSGALGKVLVACERRDPLRFREAFGGGRDELIRVTTASSEEARLQPVHGALLWHEPWVSRFRTAGRIPEFQAAQNEQAIEGYFNPNLAFAAALGFTSERALAMLYDRCINMGNSGGRRFVAQAVTPVKDDATLQKALQALKHDSVQSFQRSVGLREASSLGPKGHAALIRALRALPQPPVPVMTLDQMLDAIVAASKGRRFEHRVQELRRSGQLTDTARQVN